MQVAYKKNGIVSILFLSPDIIEDKGVDWILKKDLPVDVTCTKVSLSDFPDLLFRDAWDIENDNLTVNLNKAKEISHDMRRNKRAELLKPLDVEATVPVLTEQAEVKRQIIRDEFAAIQTEIDDAESVDQLKVIITQL